MLHQEYRGSNLHLFIPGFCRLAYSKLIANPHTNLSLHHNCQKVNLVFVKRYLLKGMFAWAFSIPKE